MTARQLLDFIGQYPAALAGLAFLPPLFAILLGMLHGRDRGGTAPWRYVYAALVYLVAIPGMGASVATAYMFFFSRENLLDANLLVYFGPVLSMVFTLLIMRKNVSFSEVPGFDRLSGLMTIIGATFLILLVIQKTFIGILFGGSIAMLAAIGAFVFALLKWGSASLFRRSSEATPKRPEFPGL